MSQSITTTLEQLAHVRQILVALTETEQVSADEHALFIERFDELMQLLQDNAEDSQYLGQEIISQIFFRYPQVAHLIPRELLWFFGGDCLHFMPDEEIDLFQQLEDLQYQAESNGESFNWLQAKQQLLQKKP
ncbi:PA2817 family protein [Entomomonas asaccharolytica]|uniref:Dehydrogenase n=1 Tax=Entomomonas asaccharolytica TaxID=2785331 RepID=A0A974NEV4_9GAMM|nr:PA2817 family protein [Entomomonas asaccharolytica]QQP85224.1 dehydrogenase [Entomomonas asaccharolytica]